MKRLDKITRLTTVGFSATELTRMSNDMLDSTYQAATPLLGLRRKEIEQVRDRENRHSRALRKKMKLQEEQRRKELDWMKTWKPVAPIQVNKSTDGAQTIRDMMDTCHRRISEFTERFRETGDQDYARGVNSARETLSSLRRELSEMKGGSR